MKQPNGLADKGAAVEEWTDRHFFRPAGMLVVRATWPLGVSADQLTIASVILGVLAGHLFLYRAAAINAVGLALFIVSDILDSADGQMARMRGTSTRFGRMLDGIADGTRFISLYGHLLARLVLAGAGWPAVVLIALTAWSHSLQSQGADFIRQAYLKIADGKGELDLPEQVVIAPGARGLAARIYRDYLRHQAALFPVTTALLRRTGGLAAPAWLQQAWSGAQRRVVRWCAVIAQNIRFPIMLAAVFGWPAGIGWITIVPLNVALVAIILRHEHNARVIAVSPEPAGALDVRVA